MYIHSFCFYILKADFEYLCADLACYSCRVLLGTDKIVWMNIVIVWIKCIDEKSLYTRNYDKNDNISTIVKLCVDNC